MSEHMSPIPSMIYNAAVGGHVTNSQQIIDENLNREQNDINQETVGAVPYNSTTPNGMGRIVLKKNDNFKEVVEAQTNGNTIFVIKYDFTLTGNVDIPANCVLEFDGGSISGGGTDKDTITGNNTQIKAADVAIFKKGIIIAGTWVCPKITSNWFSDATQTNRIRQVFNLSSNNVYNDITIEKGTYNILVHNLWEGGFSVKSNTALHIMGIIQSSTDNNLGFSEVIYIGNVSNVVIDGDGEIIGDRESHTTDENARGHGIYITNGACDIIIRGLNISKCWGDGIYIGSGNESRVKNINIINCEISLCRRQGISAINYDNIVIDKCYIHDISGAAPYNCIDIEPDHEIVSGKCVITRCHLTGLRGISVGTNYENCSANDTTIDNCNINCTEFAICVYGVVDGCTIQNSLLYGYIKMHRDNPDYPSVDNTKNIVFTNNIINTKGVIAEYGKFVSNKINLDLSSNSWALHGGCYIDNTINVNNDGVEGYVFDMLEWGGSIIPASSILMPYLVVIGNNINLFATTNGGVYPGVIRSGTRSNWLKEFNNNKVSWLEDNLDPTFGIPFYYKTDDLSTSNFKKDINKILNSLNFADTYLRVSYSRDVWFPVGSSCGGGISSYRPTDPIQGYRYFDTSLSPARPILWNGTKWVNADGTDADA